MFQVQIRPWMGIFGLLGFSGITGFIWHQPALLLGFSCFAFFGLYFQGKLNQEKKDEQLVANQQRAQQAVLRFVALMGGSLLLAATINKSGDYQARFMLQTAALAIIIGIAWVLLPALTVYYARGYLDDPK